MKKQKLKVLMVSAEIAPMAKVGGLADVVGSLPLALKKLGCDIRLIMPLYGSIERSKYKLEKAYSNIEISSAGKKYKINVWQSKLPGGNVTVYYVGSPKHFKGKFVYDPKGNNAERFLFFSLATLHVLPIIKFKPDIIHCHDFHTALIPDLLKVAEYTFFQNIKTLFTIHNLNYQGKSEVEVLSTGNLSKDSLDVLSKDARNGDINFMTQGILGADLVNTVSKKYSQEITTSFYGASLENIIQKRKKDLYGIVNGIDVKFFDPAKDKNIKQKFSVASLNKKKVNKLYLQKVVGLPQDESVPLVGLVSRLVWQKGLELIDENLLKLDCQFIFLGTGQKEYEDKLKRLEKIYPKKVRAKIMFDLKLAQQIYAGSDMFLMPSRFEPCGLGQMIAMRYGTIPVARATGGLDDTINSKLGFKFKEFSAVSLGKALKRAINLYKDKQRWQKMQKNCMKKDFSWDNSGKKYLALYKRLKK